jgi:hypothetical protein
MAAPEGAAWVQELPMPPPLFSSMLCEALGQAAGVLGPRVPGAAQAHYDAVVKCDALGPLAVTRCPKTGTRGCRSNSGTD